MHRVDGEGQVRAASRDAARRTLRRPSVGHRALERRGGRARPRRMASARSRHQSASRRRRGRLARQGRHQLTPRRPLSPARWPGGRTRFAREATAASRQSSGSRARWHSREPLVAAASTPCGPVGNTRELKPRVALQDYAAQAVHLEHFTDVDTDFAVGVPDELALGDQGYWRGHVRKPWPSSPADCGHNAGVVAAAVASGPNETIEDQRVGGCRLEAR